jgi:hypothetical protein
MVAGQVGSDPYPGDARAHDDDVSVDPFHDLSTWSREKLPPIAGRAIEQEGRGGPLVSVRRGKSVRMKIFVKCLVFDKYEFIEEKCRGLPVCLKVIP